ncbi:MAG: PAS domain S-box protein, partial [Candidatus Aminicenantes bacterium]
EEALRQANLVVENSPVVLFRWKAAEGWPVELVSENVIQFGYTPEELLSGEVSYASLVHPGDLKRVAHEVQEHSASGVNSFRQEYRIITKDGKVCWVDDRTVIERDSDGQITHYQGIVIDITKRKLAEKELQEYRDRLEEIIKERTAELTAANEQLKQEITERRWIEKALLESEKQYRELFENAIIGIYKSTPDGKIVAANPTLVKMLGYSSFEELTKHNLEKEKFMSYERSSFKEILKQDGEIIGLESKWIRKDGSARHVVENAKAIRDKNGEIIYYEGTVEDITKQKKLEANIQELREELVHVSRVTTMGELVASLAHEINQPLTAILSNAQVAQRFLDGNAPNLDELSEILSDIVKDNKRAVEVITKLRALLKKDVVNFRPLDINEAVEEIIFFVQSDMERKNVAIATELVADIPLILGDRVQLQQVILNLIMNGAEAMADTEPALRKLIIRTEKQDEQNVKVAVQDLGTGFNVDTIEHMFDSFYTTKSKGMGMGLWISRSIIEVHKGLLQAENNSDKGATFWFVIPVGKLEVN